MSKYYATITGPDGKEMKVMVIPVREIRGQTLIFLAIGKNGQGAGISRRWSGLDPSAPAWWRFLSRDASDPSHRLTTLELMISLHFTKSLIN